MKFLLMLTALALAGCATDTVLVREPVEVKVVVKVPCLDKPVEKPEFALDLEDLRSKDLYTKGAAMIKEIEQRRDYEKKMEAAMQTCSKLPESPAAEK